MSTSALYSGRVMHQRLRPLRHRLSYRVFSLLIDLDELPDLAKRLRLFSLNRFNLFSFHERDYGAGNGLNLRQHVDQQLQAAGMRTGGSIQLLTMPRILGYAFNPINVYVCHHPDGGLQAVLYEVNNTYRERHSYLIPVDAAQAEAEHIEQQCDKRMHVSPFMAMDMRYGFSLRPPRACDARMSLRVNVNDAQGPVLVAHWAAQRQALTDVSLARSLFTHPLLTLKVIVAIHWEALRLWCKGARLHPHGPAPAEPVTLVAAKDL